MTGGGRAGAPASLPRTPHQLRHGQGIDERIRSLEADWRLGLKIRGIRWSPRQKSNGDLADKVYGLVKQLFYKSRTELDQAITTFYELAPACLENGRLDLLITILSSKTEKYKTDRVSKNSTTHQGLSNNLAPSLIGTHISSRHRISLLPVSHLSFNS